MRQVYTSRFLALTVFLSLCLSFAAFAEELQRECEKPQTSEDLIRIESRQIESINDLKESFVRTYESGFRLKNRWYWNENLNSYVGTISGHEVKVAKSFIVNLTRQLEVALERGYADYIIYPDMGHGHLLVPIGAPQAGLRLEEAFLREDTQTLFHTAELLRLRAGATFSGPVDLDPWLAWRYHSRNFVARNDSSDSLSVLFGGKTGYNTVRNLPKVREFATIYFSSTKNGCFTYKQNGESFNYDISFDVSPGRRR